MQLHFDPQRVTLEALPDGILRELAPELDIEQVRSLTIDKVLSARTVKGGTAPACVRTEAVSALKRLS